MRGRKAWRVVAARLLRLNMSSTATSAIHGISSNERTGMMLVTRTIAGAAMSPPSSDKNRRLVFCNPISSPLRWLSWMRWGWSMGDE